MIELLQALPTMGSKPTWFMIGFVSGVVAMFLFIIVLNLFFLPEVAP